MLCYVEIGKDRPHSGGGGKRKRGLKGVLVIPFTLL